MDKNCYKQGIWQYYDSLGRLIQEDKYVNSNKYYLNKWVKGKQVIKNGNGRLHEYYYNGKLKAIGEVRDGKKINIWREYYINGMKQNIFKYIDWPVNYWNEVEYYRKTKLSYDTIGNITYKNGNGITYITNDTGRIAKKTCYSNNYIDSNYFYYMNGNIQSISVFHRRGVLDETVYSFYPSGIKRYEMIAIEDTIVTTEWYQNGQVSEVNKTIGFKQFSTMYNIYGQIIKILECTTTNTINEQLVEIMTMICQDKLVSE